MPSSAFEPWVDEPAAAPPPAATPASISSGQAPQSVFEPWSDEPAQGQQGVIPTRIDPETGRPIVTVTKPFTWRDTWPVKVAKDIYSAVTLPGDVAAGKTAVPTTTPGIMTEEDAFRQNQKDAETYHRTMDLAGLGIRPTSTAFGRTSGAMSAKPFAPLGEVPAEAGAYRPVAATPGQRAAVTAEETVGEALPKGVTSDLPGIQQVTAGSQSLPITGARISSKVSKVQEKSGEKVKEIADEMRQGADNRATAGPVFEQGLRDARDNNKQLQDQGYDTLRGLLPNRGDDPIHSLPRTKAVLDKIADERLRAGAPNPESGLEQFRNIQDVASFNGAQRARSEAFQPSFATKSNPGFHAGDYKRIYGAMTQDMREAAFYGAQASGKNPRQAVLAFDKADADFTRLAKENEMMDRLVESGGESALGQVIGKAGNKAGDYQTLAKLKVAMLPDKFAQIGGQALGEMGRTGDQFSLQKFSTGWKNMSDEAKAVLYDPGHRKTLDQIVDMATTINKSLEKTNRSHTAGPLITFEVGKTIGEIAAAFAVGGVGAAAVGLKGGAVAAIPFGVGYLLGNPARAASVRAVLAARAGLSTGTTPAKVAVYNIALRNLAHTLNLPPKEVTQIVQDGLPVPPPEQQPTKGDRLQRAGTNTQPQGAAP